MKMDEATSSHVSVTVVNCYSLLTLSGYLEFYSIYRVALGFNLIPYVNSACMQYIRVWCKCGSSLILQRRALARSYSGNSIEKYEFVTTQINC